MTLQICKGNRSIPQNNFSAATPVSRRRRQRPTLIKCPLRQLRVLGRRIPALNGSGRFARQLRMQSTTAPMFLVGRQLLFFSCCDAFVAGCMQVSPSPRHYPRRESDRGEQEEDEDGHGDEHGEIRVVDVGWIVVRVVAGNELRTCRVGSARRAEDGAYWIPDIGCSCRILAC